MGTTGQSITLANSIIGVGVLAMPFCYQQCGVILATFILLFMSLVSRLCCHFLLKSALLARRRNFEFLAFHVFGPAGKMAVEVGIIGFLMGTCIAYFVVVGDLGPQIISKMFNINQSDILRTSIMVIVSVVCVLPLGLLRNVDSLSNVCAATIGFYFCLVFKVILEAIISLAHGSEVRESGGGVATGGVAGGGVAGGGVAGGGMAGGGVAGGGVAGGVRMWRAAGVLQCVPIFSMALFCQTQLFEIFESLPSLSLEKMNQVTKNALNICAGVYFTLGLFGYIAFADQNISGNILMSLSESWSNDVMKLGFVLSVAFSFPLVIFPCRASLYSFLFKKVQSSHHDHGEQSIPPSSFRALTVCIVVTSLCVSLLLPNIELVLGLLGSTIGVLICVVFPAACFLNLTYKDTNERILAKVVVILGVVILFLGTYANLQAAAPGPAPAPALAPALAFLGDVRRGDLSQERLDQIVEEYFNTKRLKDSQDALASLPPEKKIIKEKLMNGKSKEDSVMQPPIPIETVENIKPAVYKDSEDKIIHESKPVVEVPATVKDVDKTDTHPRDLKTKLSNDAKILNEDVKREEKVQESLDIIKQQQLIETIKQHGEEQKELIKEQKEILDDIKKTKEQIQHDKKELESEEAKKIAVESIQKIANIAIQSLSGVTDKPNVVDAEKKPEPIKKKQINEAVKEIAMKAVESIVAIQDKVDAVKEQNDAAPNNIAPNIPALVSADNKLPVVKDQPPPAAVIKNADPPPINSQNVPSKATSIISNDKVESVKVDEQKNVISAKIVHKIETIPDQTKPAAVPEVSEQKVHSHSPDEPKSYKEGEDLQSQKLNDNVPNNVIHQNVPLAVAMNANSQTNNVASSNNVPPPNSVNSNIDNDLALPNNVVDAQIRQKRDVTSDVSKHTSNCDNCIGLGVKSAVPAETDPQGDILTKVDLNDVLVQMSPVQTIIIGRSLKSIEKSER